MPPKPAAFGRAPFCAKPLFELRRTHDDMDGSPVGPGVGCNPGPSNFKLFVS